MNVIVLALNGCPVSCLGPYGNEWVATPNLDRLAADGVVFDAHLSDNPAAARAAWLTGRHQVPPLGDDKAHGRPSVGTLLDRLRAHNVHTALVRHTRPANDGPPEFYAGWGELFDARPDPADPAPTDALLRALPAVLDRLAAHSSWLLWVELDQLLPPWHVPQHVFDLYVEDLTNPRDDDEDVEEDEDDSDLEDDDDDDEEPPPPPDVEPVTPWTEPPVGPFDSDDLEAWEFLHRSFAAAVSVLDAGLGEVFELLRERGLDTSAAWVVTAGRGYPLGEHGWVGTDRPWLHTEFVHVPLIVRLPDAAEAGRRVPAFTQPADLMPTIAMWLGAESTADHGVNLGPLLRGEVESVRAYTIAGSAGEWMVRTPEWAYFLPVGDEARPPMLFEKPDDRWEVNDLSGRHVERCEALAALLREAVARLQRPGPFDPPPLESGGDAEEPAE